MGLSSLILFIAMIFVATIAAQVLTQTVQNLQSKALDVGKQAQMQISTNINFIAINSDDGQDGYLDNAFIQARLAPGSESISFNDSVLSMFTSNGQADVIYRDGPCSNATGGFNTTSGSGYFTVEYLKNSTNHKDGYLVTGDIVKICAQLPETLSENRELKLTFIPKNGMPTSARMLTPSLIFYNQIHLYP
ncbi:flagellin [Candidatus Woesearchaeota archaeon]|nr:flagellin [Candidatus Woesearchaeota archaeon]